MKTITLTIPDDATITVDGVEYPTSTEVKLWTPEKDVWSYVLWGDGAIEHSSHPDALLEAGNVFPTREYAEALDRKRRAESVIFRYFYERGIDTRRKEGVKQFGTFRDGGKLFVCSHTDVCNGSPFWVESKAIAEQAIADIPDAIRTVLMGGWV